jgi:hypothetical protein
VSIVDTIVHSDLVVWVAESDWGYPIVLTLHAIGMALVVGIVLMFCIRVLGYANRIPLAGFQQLYPVLFIGAAINVCSGSLLFLANYTAFIHNTAFITKICLLIAGSVAAWLLAKDVRIQLQLSPGTDTITQRSRWIAAISLILWLGAITAGRIVGYTSMPE